LERAYVQSTCLAGDLDEVRQACMKLITVCMNAIRSGAQDDPIALQKIADEESARAVYFHLLGTPLAAELMRGDEIIQEHDLVPSLLSQNETELESVLQLFEPEHVIVLADQADKYLTTLELQDTETRQAQERIAQMLSYAQANTIRH
jgi:hypothetical protein